MSRIPRSTWPTSSSTSPKSDTSASPTSAAVSGRAASSPKFGENSPDSLHETRGGGSSREPLPLPLPKPLSKEKRDPGLCGEIAGDKVIFEQLLGAGLRFRHTHLERRLVSSHSYLESLSSEGVAPVSFVSSLILIWAHSRARAEKSRGRTARFSLVFQLGLHTRDQHIYTLCIKKCTAGVVSEPRRRFARVEAPRPGVWANALDAASSSSFFRLEFEFRGGLF